MPTFRPFLKIHERLACMCSAYASADTQLVSASLKLERALRNECDVVVKAAASPNGMQLSDVQQPPSVAAESGTDFPASPVIEIAKSGESRNAPVETQEFHAAGDLACATGTRISPEGSNSPGTGRESATESTSTPHNGVDAREPGLHPAVKLGPVDLAYKATNEAVATWASAFSVVCEQHMQAVGYVCSVATGLLIFLTFNTAGSASNARITAAIAAYILLGCVAGSLTSAALGMLVQSNVGDLGFASVLHNCRHRGETLEEQHLSVPKHMSTEAVYEQLLVVQLSKATKRARNLRWVVWPLYGLLIAGVAALVVQVTFVFLVNGGTTSRKT